MKKYLWLAVTPDEYELPIIVEESSGKLAAKLKTRPNNIIAYALRGASGCRSGYKIIKIEVEEEVCA